MARIRTIKPEFWDDEKLADIPVQARLVFVGTWNFADDFGVLVNSAKYIKSKLFPYDETLREHQVKTWLDALINARMLIPFECENKSYLFIRTFNSHQLIDKRYTKSILPKGKLVSEMLAGLDLQEITTLPHSEHIVNTRSNSKGSVKEKEVEKESKEKIRPLVFLLKSEIETLEKEFSKEDCEWIFDKLQAAKLAKGYVYKSDYGAICSWVKKSLNEEKQKNKQNGRTGTTTHKTNHATAKLTEDPNYGGRL